MIKAIIQVDKDFRVLRQPSWLKDMSNELVGFTPIGTYPTYCMFRVNLPSAHWLVPTRDNPARMPMPNERFVGVGFADRTLRGLGDSEHNICVMGGHSLFEVALTFCNQVIMYQYGNMLDTTAKRLCNWSLFEWYSESAILIDTETQVTKWTYTPRRSK